MCELDAADLRRGDDVSGNTDDKQITKALIEDDLRWHPRIGTSENDVERLLARRQRIAGQPRPRFIDEELARTRDRHLNQLRPTTF